MSGQTIYLDGEYLAKNPGWHVGESPWKARQILHILRKNRITAKTICEVGCGAGEVLKQLQETLDNDCVFLGYDVSPQVFELAKGRAKGKLQFRLGDFLEEQSNFDLILVLDVIEHLEDYFSFLKRGDLYAHLHYFTKETALRTLVDTGYEVLDYFYTLRSIVFGSEPGEKLLKLPRKACFAINRDFAARFLGGFSLLVLAR
jgi:SAM-dependent methyltransferase